MPRSKIIGPQGNLGRRNIFINPKMEIDQRHKFASHTISSGSDFFADRWGFYSDGNATGQYGATTQVVDDAPSGFNKSLKWTTTSVGGSGIPATSEVIFRQPIEGTNIRRVNYGTAQAQNLMLSFYVKSSVAGNYGLQCQFEDTNSAQNYIQRSYTISAANTWERVSVSIPANTTKIMKYQDNTGAGLRVNWDLGEGATYSSAASNSWTQTYTNGLTGGVKIAEVNGATWQITGCQLEIGDVMSDFEHRSFGEELALCQRYYHEHIRGHATLRQFVGGGDFYTTTQLNCHINFPTSMRTKPTMIQGNGTDYLGWWGGSQNGDISSAFTLFLPGENCTSMYVNPDDDPSSSGIGCRVYIKAASSVSGTTNAFFAFQAEL